MPKPLVKDNVVAALKQLGVRSGLVLMVHSSLSSLGYVVGGPQTVVGALLDVLGPDGTLVMPAFSPEVSDPVNWPDKQFEDKDLERVRSSVPAFDPDTTPTSMGAIAETFRNWPNVVRSPHPQVSVIACGPKAEFIVSEHHLEWGEGMNSPFERLYDLDANILLLGVGFNRVTMLHYAESLVSHGRRKTRVFPVDKDGVREWISATDVGDDLNTHFPAIGEAFLETGNAAQGIIGRAPSALVSSRQLVDLAREFLSDALAR